MINVFYVTQKINMLVDNEPCFFIREASNNNLHREIKKLDPIIIFLCIISTHTHSPAREKINPR